MSCHNNRQSSVAAITAASARSLSTLRAFATCLIILMLSHLPASADVYHLWYDNVEWQNVDLTTLTSGATPGGPALTSLYTAGNDQLHVYYIDTNEDVHQLYYNNVAWTDENLTAIAGGPAASFFGIASFAIGNLQYVFYVSYSDSHVHELNYNNATWVDQDLTALSGGSTANFYTPDLVAFSTQGNDQFHVYFEDPSYHTHQLYFNGSFWQDQDLTAMTGAECFPGAPWPPSYTGYIAGFAEKNEQHLFCGGLAPGGQQEHMLHIYYNNIEWTYEDITAKVNGLTVGFDSAVAAFNVGTKLEVYGVTADTHVHQYTKKGTKWSDLDMTASEGAPADGWDGGAVAFSTPGPQFHAYYLDGSPEVYQLYFNGTNWSVQDLTGGAGTAYGETSPVTGFAIRNLQHVFYLGY